MRSRSILALLTLFVASCDSQGTAPVCTGRDCMALSGPAAGGQASAAMAASAAGSLGGAPAAGSGGVERAADAPAGCTGSAPSITNVTPELLSEMLKSKDFELINVHTPYEGEIESTDAHIAFNDISGIAAHLQNDRAAKALLYCRSGSMSLKAATALIGMGFCHILDMPGGMNAWSAAGFALKK